MEKSLFKVGDIVEAEMTNESSYPRWDMERDRGGNGEWIEGRVVEEVSDAGTIIVDFGQFYWVFYTSEDGRQREGWLRHKSKA